MEKCKQVAVPLAQAICDNLRKQDVDVNVAILTSYLLDMYPGSGTEGETFKDIMVKKQIDQEGRFGDVCFSLEKSTSVEDVKLMSDHEYLLVFQNKTESKCAVLSGVNKEENTFQCLESLPLGTSTSVSSTDESMTIYRLWATWRPNEELHASEPDDDDSIVVLDVNSEKEDSFLLLNEETEVELEKLIKITEISMTSKAIHTADINDEIQGIEEDKEIMNLNISEDTNIDSIEQQLMKHETEINKNQKDMAAAVADQLAERRKKPDKSSTTCLLQDSVRGNTRKKLLVIGKTGTGKSSLCNVLTGNLPNAKIFPVSAKANTCTQQTTFADANFCGDPSKPLSVIDTIGFDDPTKDHDAKIIAELVLQLQQNCDYINTFVMAVNGQNPRLDGSLISMIKILEKMFTKKFWDQTVIVFTRLHMDQASKERRFEESDHSTDDDLAREYLDQVEEIFGTQGSQLSYVFIDSQYRQTDFDEVQAFHENTGKLCQHLKNHSELPTSEVTSVLTENQKLWSKITKLKMAAGVAAGGGAAAIGVATVKSAIAETAIREAAKAVAEKTVAVTAAAAAQAELAKMGQELATMAVAPVTKVAMEPGGLVTAIPVVLGVMAAVVAWSLGIPLPPIP